MKIPKFRSEEEEAEFWDTHDTTEFWDETEEVPPEEIEIDQGFRACVLKRVQQRGALCKTTKSRARTATIERSSES